MKMTNHIMPISRFFLLTSMLFYGYLINAQTEKSNHSINDSLQKIKDSTEVHSKYLRNSTFFFSYENIKDQLKIAKENSDSLSITQLQIYLSELDRYHGDFDLAFEKLWEALLIAEKNNYHDLIIKTHRGLGILYDIYNKDSLALKHLNTAVSISKNILKTGGQIKEYELVSNYFSISNYWRDRKEYDKALLYLDSCSFVYDHKKVLPYVLADRGYCYLQLGKLEESEDQLFKAKFHLEAINAPYIVPNLSFIGDLKKAQYQYDSALYYYTESLRLLDHKNIHTDFKPDLLEKTSELYIIKGDLLKAVNKMKASKKSYKKLFSATSKRNQRLFEIKNNYKAELTKNKILIQQQEGLIAKKNKRFYLILTSFIVSFLLGIGLYLIVRQRNKIKKLSLVSQLDKEKNKAILEVKSKELTAYALKMIEMEEAVSSILNTIKKSNPKDYQSLKNKYLKGADNSWQEFNRRFTEVNTNFHSTLCKKHPDLSATELKHCALIKLNFNSHEMAKMLNISVQSVHTSRYRIRKKMELDSNSSLEIYIGSM